MAKIILSIGDTVMQEVTLSKERVTIGRRIHNDIVIDSLAISGEHAVIVTQNTDSFLEDLNSTNGTQVNGQPVKKHFLQDNDVIELAHYRIRYFAGDDKTANCGKTSRGKGATARIKVLNGANEGRETMLTKVLTTIGRPNSHIAFITRQSDGFYITHVEGNNYALLNGVSVGKNPHKMANGDIIDLSGTQVQFLLD